METNGTTAATHQSKEYTGMEKAQGLVPQYPHAPSSAATTGRRVRVDAKAVSKSSDCRLVLCQ